MKSTAVAMFLMALALWTVVTAPPHCEVPAERAVVYPFALEPILDGRDFAKPTQAVQHPADPGTWFVAIHNGVLLRVNAAGATTVLDIRDRVAFGGEFGLQSVALHPDFPKDRRLFVAYSIRGPAARVSVFEAAQGDDLFDPASETVLLTEDAAVPWHSVGQVGFGPDRKLYVSWGDGDRPERGSLRSKLLRIDVDGGVKGAGGAEPYAIPPDNPRLGPDYPPESYAVGFRMPWRFGFDRLTGALWVGDVGAHRYEEIDRVEAGGDYGWPRWEGTVCRQPDTCWEASPTPPFFQHASTDMCAIVGGFVYRGRGLAELYGRYVYGDACSGTIRALDLEADPPVSRAIARTEAGIGSFAEDRDGELYVVEAKEGPRDVTVPARGFRVLALVRAPADEMSGVRTAAARLSSLGCVAERGFRHAPSGLVAYGVSQPAWADGATSYRFITPKPMLPVWGVNFDSMVPATGSLLMKTLAVDGRPVETQMLVRRRSGRWDTYDYGWTEDGSDAVAVSAPTDTRLPDGSTWSLPGSEQCGRCHNSEVGHLRAFSASQLNTGFEGYDQIARLEAIGTIVWPWKGSPIPVMPAIDDASATIADRARAYLDVNCAHCHQPGGQAGSASMDLRRTTRLALAGVCGLPPNATVAGHGDASLIDPGSPKQSLVYLRMTSMDATAMPPQRRAVDARGAELIAAWIRALDGCSDESRADGAGKMSAKRVGGF